MLIQKMILSLFSNDISFRYLIYNLIKKLEKEYVSEIRVLFGVIIILVSFKIRKKKFSFVNTTKKFFYYFPSWLRKDQ